MGIEEEFPVHILEVDINREPEMFGKSYNKYEEIGYVHIFLPTLRIHVQNIPFYIQDVSNPKYAVSVTALGKKRYFEGGQTRVNTIYHEDFDIWKPILSMIRSYLLKERVEFDDGYIEGPKKDWCSKTVITYSD